MWSLFTKRNDEPPTAQQAHKARELALAIRKLEQEGMLGGAYVNFVYEFKELVARRDRARTVIYLLPGGGSTPSQAEAVEEWAHTVTVGALLGLARESRPPLEWERKEAPDIDEAAVWRMLDRCAEKGEEAYHALREACGQGLGRQSTGPPPPDRALRHRSEQRRPSAIDAGVRRPHVSAVSPRRRRVTQGPR